MKRYALGVDIGATYLRVGIGAWNGKVLKKVKVRTPRRIERIPLRITRIVKEHFSAHLKQVIGGCIASIGPLDIKRGEIISPPNIGEGRVAIVKALSEELGLEFTLLNDAVAGVLAEKKYGAGRDVENLVYLTISTGIGAGVIVDNNLLLGKDGNAHEVGHMTIDYKSRLKCSCGGIGHWEAYASGRGIPRFTVELYKSGPEKYSSSILRGRIESGRLKAQHVFEAARSNDILGLDVVNELKYINAAGISNVINCYDPELIVLGGSVALNNRELLIEPLRKLLGKYVINRPPRIRLTKLGEDVVLKGAFANVFGNSKF